MLTDALAVTLLVTEALERLGIPYAVGGSIASAVHGVARSTLDADVVADLRPEHAEPLYTALANDLYADFHAIQDAIRRRTSFNFIHLESMFKVDVFVARPYALDRAQLQRRHLQVLATDPTRMAYVVAPEEIVLAKLDWYRAGGEVSDRQWRDVLGVLRVQASQLDLAHLRQLARELSLADLLDRALSESRPSIAPDHA